MNVLDYTRKLLSVLEDLHGDNITAIEAEETIAMLNSKAVCTAIIFTRTELEEIYLGEEEDSELDDDPEFDPEFDDHIDDEY